MVRIKMQHALNQVHQQAPIILAFSIHHHDIIRYEVHMNNSYGAQVGRGCGQWWKNTPHLLHGTTLLTSFPQAILCMRELKVKAEVMIM